VSPTVGVIAVLALIVANAFFVAAEFSLVAVDRTQVDLRAAEGSRPARVTAAVLRRLSFHLSGAQLGITVCSLGLGVLAEPAVAPLIEPLIEPLLGDRYTVAWSVVLALLVTTVVQMVAGELIPKGVAVSRPLRTALALAAPFRVFAVVFRPFIAVCDAAAAGLLRLVGMEPAEELSSVRSRDELHRLVRSSEEGGTLVQQAADLLDRSFRFGGKTAADAMTPRPAVQALSIEGTTGDLLAASADTGLSRFPVHRGELDDIEGVVHVKDVLGLPPERRSDEPLAALLRPVLMVPETRDLASLMVELQDEAGQFAVVLDEYAGVAGIITLEDLVEEIVGEIADEHDPQMTVPPVRTWAGAHLLSGRLHHDEVEHACGLDLPGGDFETLAGFVLDRLGRIPEVGDGFTHEGWSVEVAEMAHHRVATVRLVAPAPEPEVLPSGNGGRP
jgi:CBS domain containing-hemolysin-like protein